MQKNMFKPKSIVDIILAGLLVWISSLFIVPPLLQILFSSNSQVFNIAYTIISLPYNIGLKLLGADGLGAITFLMVLPFIYVGIILAVAFVLRSRVNTRLQLLFASICIVVATVAFHATAAVESMSLRAEQQKLNQLGTQMRVTVESCKTDTVTTCEIRLENYPKLTTEYTPMLVVRVEDESGKVASSYQVDLMPVASYLSGSITFSDDFVGKKLHISSYQLNDGYKKYNSGVVSIPLSIE